jgi:hypothetical protein
MDITLPAGEAFEQVVSSSDNAFIFVIEGNLLIGSSRQPLGHRELGILGEGDHIAVTSENSARFLLVAGQPLSEPVARGGPFVMNTKTEIMQAFSDYQNGRF